MLLNRGAVTLRRYWSARLPDTTEPVMRSGQCYEYFLEGFIARDFIDDLGAPSNSVSVEVCERLIRYAIYNA